MKKSFLTFFAGISIFCCSAQGNKPVVTVEKFTGTPERAVTFLRNKVIAAIQQAERVNVVDVTNDAQLNAEIERRKNERAMNDAGRVSDVSMLMSNGLLKGNLDNISTQRSESTDKKGKKSVSYSSTVNYTLTLINAENGTTISQKNFKDTGSGDSEAEAVEDALNVKITPIKRFILNAFEVRGKVIAMANGDGKKAKTVYINRGTADGIKKGQKMDVFKEIDIAGEKSQKLIGEIQVEEVMSAGRSLCKVTKKGEIILKEIEAGATLPIKTQEQKSNFIKGIFEN